MYRKFPFHLTVNITDCGWPFDQITHVTLTPNFLYKNPTAVNSCNKSAEHTKNAACGKYKLQKTFLPNNFAFTSFKCCFCLFTDLWFGSVLSEPGLYIYQENQLNAFSGSARFSSFQIFLNSPRPMLKNTLLFYLMSQNLVVSKYGIWSFVVL